MPLPRQADKISCRERFETVPYRVTLQQAVPVIEMGTAEENPVKHAGHFIPLFLPIPLPYARICLFEVIFSINPQSLYFKNSPGK